MTKRPKALKYAGKAGEHIRGIPARDLDESDIAGLTEQQLTDATTPGPVTKRALYREVSERTEKPKAERPAVEPEAQPAKAED